MGKFVKGSYATIEEANQAIDELATQGYNKELITLVTNKETRDQLPELKNVGVNTDHAEDDESLWDKIKDFFTADDSGYEIDEEVLEPYQDDIDNGKIVVLVDDFTTEEGARDYKDSTPDSNTSNTTEPPVPNDTLGSKDTGTPPTHPSNRNNYNPGMSAVQDSSNLDMPSPIGDNLGTTDTGLPPIGGGTVGGSGVPPIPDDTVGTTGSGIPPASVNAPTTDNTVSPSMPDNTMGTDDTDDATVSTDTGNTRVPPLTENNAEAKNTSHSNSLPDQGRDLDTNATPDTDASLDAGNTVDSDTNTDPVVQTYRPNDNDDGLGEVDLDPEDRIGSEDFGQPPMPNGAVGNDITNAPPHSGDRPGAADNVLPPTPDDTINPGNTVDPSIPNDTNVPPMPSAEDEEPRDRKHPDDNL